MEAPGTQPLAAPPAGPPGVSAATLPAAQLAVPGAVSVATLPAVLPGVSAATLPLVPPAGVSASTLPLVPPAGVSAATLPVVPPAGVSAATLPVVPPAGVSAATLPVVPLAGVSASTLPLVPPAGVSASTLPAVPPAAPAAPLGFKGTMIGMAPPTPTPPGAPPATPHTAPLGLKGTMIGMAPPVPEPPPGSPAAPADPNAGPGGPKPPAGPHKRTMLGVALPGIAPIRPGVAKPEAPAVPEPPPPDWQPGWPQPGWPEPAALPADEAPLASIAGVPRPHRIPWTAAFVIVLAAGLLTAAVVVFFLYRARGAIEAKLGSDAEGRERLEVVCTGCADGAKLRLGAASAAFRGGRAALPLERKLPVGQNRVEVNIERSPGRSDKVELIVPVEYRVRAETAGLAEPVPHLVVRVQALPGTAVVVDGKPLTLDAQGNASGDVPVIKELTGADSGVRTLERRVPYVITPPGGTPATGEVSARIGIAPLAVTSPGPSIVIDGPTFVLAGRTAKNASLTVEGRAITVDANGGFAQIMSVSAPGETSVVVRASAPDHAPRLYPLRVRRVDSLAAEAALVRARAATSYAAIADNPDQKRGLAVALDGSVVEARTESFTTTLILDVTSGCPKAPCLARVSWGNKLALAAGDKIGAFGELTGSVDGPQTGTRIPSIAADFLLKGKP